MAFSKTAAPICPVCGGSPAALTDSPIFSACLFCAGCEVHFALTQDAPTYPAEYFGDAKKPGALSRFARPALRFLLSLRFKKILSSVERKEPGRILDYGCGSGALVEYGARRGFDIVGYDPSSAAVAEARRRGLPVFGELPAGPFDLIMFWHSLEHADNPHAVLERAKARLQEDGHFLIAVPNAASWEAKIAKERWFHYDHPFHRVHFTPRSLGRLLGRSGFAVESADFFTPEYTFTGLLQTFLNFVFPKNALYSIVAHRRFALPPSQLAAAGFASLAGAVLFSPFIFLFFAAALIFRRTGAMVVVAKRI